MRCGSFVAGAPRDGVSIFLSGGVICRAGFRRAGFGGDLHVGETVVVVDGLEGAYVGGDQGLTVSAVAVERIGGVDAEQFLEEWRS